MSSSPLKITFLGEESWDVLEKIVLEKFSREVLLSHIKNLGLLARRYFRKNNLGKNVFHNSIFFDQKVPNQIFFKKIHSRAGFLF